MIAANQASGWPGDDPRMRPVTLFIESGIRAPLTRLAPAIYIMKKVGQEPKGAPQKRHRTTTSGVSRPEYFHIPVVHASSSVCMSSMLRCSRIVAIRFHSGV